VTAPEPTDPRLLEAEIQLRLSRLSLDASLSVAAGEVLALVGPNGSGKSTVLRALAGFLDLAGGRVVLDGKVLEEPARKVRVQPEDRPVAMMFQEYLLFPHMSALENVAFGLRARGMDRKSARAKAATALSQVGLEGLGEARPRQMSGGQQQRVAMARALITDPKLLLLDEPLAALDVSTKAEIRRHLRSVLRQSTAANVMVTHDLLDALALADRMAVIESGTIVQTGTPADVAARPKSAYVAHLVGVNLLEGDANGGEINLAGGSRLVTAASASGRVLAAIAPASVAVSRQAPDDGTINAWPGQITTVDLLGDRVRVKIDGPPELTAEVAPSAVEELQLDDGGQLWATVNPSDVTVYPP
jgi:molybdate transport system ATP-binding protein